jgi:hypothetical protein
MQPAAEPLGGGTGLGEPDDRDGEAEVVFVAALWVDAPQPASTMKPADTAIAGRIRFGFTARSFTR